MADLKATWQLYLVNHCVIVIIIIIIIEIVIRLYYIDRYNMLN